MQAPTWLKRAEYITNGNNGMTLYGILKQVER